MSDGLTLISGIVSNLEFYDGEEEFIRSAGQRAAGAGAAVGLAAAGVAGAAVGASIAASSGGDSVQFFSCNVGDQPVAGRFSKASFKAADELIAVIEKQQRSTDQIAAVMRPRDQTLWMVPHCSRGINAHRLFCFRVFFGAMAAVLVVVGGFFGILDWHSEGTWDKSFTLFWMALVGANALVIACYYSIRFYFQWRPVARQAERIFAALGYPNPSRVDLPRDHKKYCKIAASLAVGSAERGA